LRLRSDEMTAQQESPDSDPEAVDSSISQHVLELAKTNHKDIIQD